MIKFLDIALIYLTMAYPFMKALCSLVAVLSLGCATAKVADEEVLLYKAPGPTKIMDVSGMKVHESTSYHVYRGTNGNMKYLNVVHKPDSVISASESRFEWPSTSTAMADVDGDGLADVRCVSNDKEVTVWGVGTTYEHLSGSCTEEFEGKGKPLSVNVSHNQ